MVLTADDIGGDVVSDLPLAVGADADLCLICAENDDRRHACLISIARAIT